LAQGCRIGARARYQADLKPDVRKRPLRAHRTERVGRRKDDLEIGASRLHAAKEFRRIGRDRIAGAFHHQGVGWQRKAKVESLKEDIRDFLATHRIRRGKAEINAIESLCRSEIEVLCKFQER